MRVGLHEDGRNSYISIKLKYLYSETVCSATQRACLLFLSLCRSFSDLQFYGIIGDHL